LHNFDFEELAEAKTEAIVPLRTPEGNG